MLKLPTKFSFELPSLDLSLARPMEFSPVTEDNDELLQSVYARTQDPDTNWHLSDSLDFDELEAYWNAVESNEV